MAGSGRARAGVPARGRPAGHTGPEIIAAACALADRDGLEAVTMRRVAAELGAGAASLYTYVATREALLELMQDAAAAEYVLGEPTGDWLADVLAVMMQTRTIMLRHRWLIPLALARPSMGPRMADVLEHVLAALADHPAGDVAKVEAFGVLHAVVVVFVQSETVDHTSAERAIATMTKIASDGRHPRIAALDLRSDGSGDARLRRTLAGTFTGLLG